MNTCDGCKHNRGTTCHARAPLPRTDGRALERAQWPLHGNLGCGEFASVAPPEFYPDAPNPRRVKLSK